MKTIEIHHKVAIIIFNKIHTAFGKDIPILIDLPEVIRAKILAMSDEEIDEEFEEIRISRLTAENISRKRRGLKPLDDWDFVPELKDKIGFIDI